MSLLEKAKQYKKSRGTRGITDEDIELAFAWLNDEVNTVQVGAAYDSKAGSALMYKMGLALKAAYKKGKIKIIN